jgi:hypothetical protein
MNEKFTNGLAMSKESRQAREDVKSRVMSYFLDKNLNDSIKIKNTSTSGNDGSTITCNVAYENSETVATHELEVDSNNKTIKDFYSLRKKSSSSEHLVLRLQEGVEKGGEYSDLFAINGGSGIGFPPERLTQDYRKLFVETFNIDLPRGFMG